MKSIAIIIPYIGKLRDDFPFWMESVRANSTIDFFLFTNDLVENPPKNLYIYKTTFNQLKQMFQNHFDFEICLRKPYKFCDFRPSYGEVFNKYIDGYDFWGYCDIDMIFGNIRKFITDDLLDSYDHIFGRGHFSLYRNNVIVNSEYKRVVTPNYKQVFSYDEGRAFDEYCGTSKHWVDNLQDRFYDRICFDDIDCFSYPFVSQMRRKEYVGCENNVYAFNDGSVFRIYEKNGIVEKMETLYVHFQKRDMLINCKPSSGFLMIPNSYESYEEIMNIERLRQLGKRDSFYLKKYKIKWEQIRSRPYKLFLRIFPSKFGYPLLPSNISQYYIENME